MSLFDNIASQVSGGIGGEVSARLGGGVLARTAGGIAGAIGQNTVLGAVNKVIPTQARNAVNTGIDAARSVLDGDYEGAAMRVFDSGLLNDIFPGASGIAAQARYWGTPTPLFGGITPTEAKRIYNSMRGLKLAKKNLFLIEVVSRVENAMNKFNLFVTDVEYAPLTITGEKHKIGSATVDSVRAGEPIELRFTTMDDEYGTIKRWFAEHCSAVVNADGTVGVPDQFAIRFKIVHGFITPDSNTGGYEDIGLFRPANMEVSLSRRECAMQELQMTFSQLDTFVAP